MKAKNIVILLFMLALLLGCSDNIFGSSGSGATECGNDISCLRIEAEEAFRSGKYKESYDLYEKIVDADSKASVGYFGMAKAGLWAHGLTLFGLVGLNRESEYDDPMRVIFESNDTLQNDYLQGSKKAYRALQKLKERDSLTKEYNKGTLKCPNNDCFVYNSPKDKNGKDETFPLTDGEFGEESFSSGFYITQTLFESMLIAFDFWGNECIYKTPPQTEAKAREMGCIFESFPLRNKSSILEYSCNENEDGGEECSLQPNFEGLYEDISDPAEGENNINEINDILDNIDSRMEDLIRMINQGDPDSRDEMQAKLEEMKGYTSFFKMNMGIDTDGDGCIDEELIFKEKTYDTDGDGLSGENSRVIQIPDNAFDGCGSDPADVKCHYTPADYGIDHNMNKNKGDDFIMYITQKEAGLDTNIRVAWSLGDYWVSKDKDLRKAVQTESERCYGLEERKSMVGGCWKNYSPTDFSNYRNNPEQITKGGMNPLCKGTI